jgi:apolipoprotein N-acyltransferase
MGAGAVAPPAPAAAPPAPAPAGRARAVRTLRRAALAVLGGVLLYAGHPPLDVAWAGWVALAPLLLLARDIVTEDGPRRLRRGAGWGLLAGLTFLVPLLEWLSPFGGVVPWLVVALMEALTVAAFVAGVVAWGRRPGRVVMAVVWWVALEALRGSVPLGGFPWGLLGYTQHDGGPLLPLARTLGVLGVSAACAAIAACAEELLARRRSLRTAVAPAAGLVLVVVLAPLLGGAPPSPSGRTLDVAAVQGADLRLSVAAGINRQDGRVLRVAEQLLTATRPLADDPPDVTVWPENSLDSDITDPRNTRIREILDEALALLDGGPLIANTFEDAPRHEDRPELPTYYNTVLEITDQGIDERYRKQRPVPVGEFVPARALLELYPLAEQLPGYDVLAAGPQPPLTVAGTRIATAICYENVWTEVLRDQVRDGAEIALVSTNNTPFGGAMSQQHLAFSQLRAVETGRWVVHAGLSGISGLVDPSGTVSQRTQQDAEALVRADIPLIEAHTPATEWGELVGPSALTLSALGLLYLVVSRRR